MSGYIGTQPVPQATQTRDVFTATSGQTIFATSGYTPGYVDVWLNGVKLVNGDDFTATNGSDVVLTSGAAAGDTVEVLAFTSFDVIAQQLGIVQEEFTATAGQTTFVTSGYTAGFVEVFLNGFKLNAEDFAATGTTDVVLATAAGGGDQVTVVIYNAFSVSNTVSASAGGTFNRPITVNGDAATVLTVDRATSEGSIVDFKKDGATVGSVGTYASFPYLASTTNSLLLSNKVMPATNTGDVADGVMDLGQSDRRFKDLYLSGGVYLGGTGSANLLDDYEEGTWTPAIIGGTTNPTVTYSDNYGYYTKVGRLVHVYGRTQISTISGGAGYLFISGLPFTVNSYGGRYATGSLGYTGGWNTITPLVIIAPHNTSRVELYGSSGTSSRDSITSIIYLSYAQAGSDIIYSLTYETT